MIPTYNEAINIEKLIESIMALKIVNLSIVVVDDNSPDGTWKIVEDFKKKYSNVHIIRRMNDRGRGRAGIEGFQHCLNNKADIILEMDADFSHDPKDIPALLKGLERADVVLGSRRVTGGKDIGRPWWRKSITFLANLYIRLITGMNVKDCNSGFRAFRSPVLKGVQLENFTSIGPSIVQELLYKSYIKGYSILEIPIVFKEREVGNSKMRVQQLYQGYLFVLYLRWKKYRGKL